VVVLIPRTTIIPTKRGARANYRPDVWHIGAFDTRRNALHGAIPLFELGQIVPPPRLFVHFPLAICSCKPPPSDNNNCIRAAMHRDVQQYSRSSQSFSGMFYIIVCSARAGIDHEADMSVLIALHVCQP
jgi:hypothetical protein